MSRRNLQITEAPKLERTPQQMAEDHCQPYLTKLVKYAEQINGAIASANDWWLSRYQAEKAAQAAFLEMQANTIREHAERLKFGSDESIEKGISDAVKAIKEARLATAAWRARVILPVEQLLQSNNRVLDEMLAEAEQREKNEPLISNGLVNHVKEIARGWAKYRFDESLGRILVC